MDATLPDARLAPLSAVPGLVHGFGRRGPTSESRAATRARVGEAVHGSGRPLWLRQVHGARIVPAPWDDPPEADGAWSATPGDLLAIETADCLPVLLVDPVGRRVAAAHAGWRGSAEGIAPAAVAALVERGSRAGDLIVALGPSIGVCCYEVGDEVRARFGAEAAAAFRPGGRGRAHLDLQAANRIQLERVGVAPGAIHAVTECTACRPDLYHSFRRDGQGAGRMISHVGFALALPG